jgi:hypothetical protein
MIRTIRILSLIVLSMAFHSCFKKDEMIPSHPRGPVKTDTIAMTDTYKYQVYFDLASGKAISTNLKTESDLGFECSSKGWKIILNTSDFMKVADLGVIPFGQSHDTTGLKWKFDKSDGNSDSLAFGNWYTILKGDTVSANHVYAIDRGMDQNGNPLGFYQLIFDSLKNGTYYFRFARLNGLDIHSGAVTKDSSVNFRWYSFSSGGAVKNLEPSKDSYDLLFTQYTTLLFTDQGAAYPYLVTGVLLNRNGIEAIKDSIQDFNSVTLENVNAITLSSALDVIGYDWKKFDFNAGSYTVRTGIFYVIRDKTGYLYKLRFIGFYNEKGEKGYPVIEYQAL